MIRFHNIMAATAALIFGAVCTRALAADNLTLDQAIKSALTNNGRYLSARQMALSAHAKAKSVGAWDDPMLMFGISNVPTNFDFRMDPMTMTMFGLSQSFPLASQRGMSAKAEDRSADAADAMARMTAIDVQVEVRAAYHELYFKRLILSELRNQRAIQSEMVQTATDRFKIGMGGQAEVTSVQASAFRFESQIRSAEQEVFSAASRLAALTGVPIGENTPLEALPLDTIPDADSVWVNRAVNSSVELSRLESQSDSYAFSARAENRMRWPMLTISASYGVRRDGPDTHGISGKRDNMVSFGASFSLPIFSGKRNGNMAQSMRLMSMAADAERAQVERDVVAQIKSLHSRARSLSRSIDSYEQDVIPASEQSYQGALASYRTNQMNLGILLSYSMQLVSDRITLIQLRLELASTLDQVSRYLVDSREMVGSESVN